MIILNGINYYTTQEAAKKLGVHLRTLQKHVTLGNILPFRRSAKKFYFTDDVLEKFIKGE